MFGGSFVQQENPVPLAIVLHFSCDKTEAVAPKQRERYLYVFLESNMRCPTLPFNIMPGLPDLYVLLFF